MTPEKCMFDGELKLWCMGWRFCESGDTCRFAAIHANMSDYIEGEDGEEQLMCYVGEDGFPPCFRRKENQDDDGLPPEEAVRMFLTDSGFPPETTQH